MSLTASAQGQPPASCAGQWIFGPGQDNRALNSTQIGGLFGTMRAVEWDSDGRSGPEKPWLVMMAREMRPFAWDGERWLALPQVPGGIADDDAGVVLVVYRNELYTTGRTPDAGVLKLQGGAWTTAFTTGRLVTALAVDGDQLLVADGLPFSNLPNRGEQRLGAWNGTTYTMLATGLIQANTVQAHRTLAIARWNGDLYVGGQYAVPATSSSGTPTFALFNIARVLRGADGAVGAFETLPRALGAGLPGGSVQRLVATASELRAVYLSGSSLPPVAVWNGSTWRSDGAGEPFLIEGELYRQIRVGTNDAFPEGQLQRLEGDQWVNRGAVNQFVRPSIGVIGRDLVQRDDTFYAVNRWLSVDDAIVRRPDRGVGDSLGQWTRMLIDGNRAIFAGTSRTSNTGLGPQGQENTQVASFDGYQWRGFGQLMTSSPFNVGAYYAVADIARLGSMLYASSRNRYVGDVAINGIASWNGQAWQTLGDGLSATDPNQFTVGRMIVFQNELIVGGRFNRAGDQVVANVARWNSSSWRPMGQLPDRAVFAELGGKLYAFAGGLYQWDGAAWQQRGKTVPRRELDLAAWNGELYLAGTFVEMSGTPIAYLAVYRNGDWRALPIQLQDRGTSAAVFSLSPRSDGLWAHGRFALPGETTEREQVARWTGTTWEPVVASQSTDGYFMASGFVGPELFVSGNFRTINGRQSTHYARWSPDGRPWIAQPPRSATSSIGGSVDFKAEAATGYTGLVFKWLRNGEELADGTTAAGSSVLGANTRWLTVSNLQAADAGSYVLRISNPCGQSLSTAATLTLRCSVSDVAGANQSIGSDGVLTADDIIVYLSWFFAGDTRADIAGPNQSTTPDGNLTADDIIVFLSRYFAGC